MTEAYKCQTCGVVTADKGHLCNPIPVAEKCDYCGDSTEDARHMCKPMCQKLEYTCGSCGRPAEQADLLCHPKKMPG